LKGTTKGEVIFHAVENGLCKNNLDLEIISGILTNGAPAMDGKEKGAKQLLIEVEFIRKTNNFWKRDDLFIIHCLIYQQNLCSQVLSMNHVMQVVIKTVNYIRSHALPHRQFKEFLKKLDLEYGVVVYFSHVRWLSRGKCLKRFYELRHEIDLFMN